MADILSKCATLPWEGTCATQFCSEAILILSPQWFTVCGTVLAATSARMDQSVCQMSYRHGGWCIFICTISEIVFIPYKNSHDIGLILFDYGHDSINAWSGMNFGWGWCLLQFYHRGNGRRRPTSLVIQIYKTSAFRQRMVLVCFLSPFILLKVVITSSLALTLDIHHITAAI